MIDRNAIFNIKNQSEFQDLALQVFNYQFNNNKVYRSFCDLLYKHPSDVKTIRDIPFLPIQFFKTHQVLSSDDEIETTFTSSGTTGSEPSRHDIIDLDIYEQSFRAGFSQFYGNVKDYIVLALLPSYMERGGSSLIYMVNDMISRSGHEKSGFYLNNLSELKNTLITLDKIGEKVLLIGVSFALLNLVETYQFNLEHTIIMETGGMKGRRKELIREELHNRLKQGFGVNTIHSEYGMTELLSQAYSSWKGIYNAPPWMHVLTRDTEDPITILSNGKTGGLNIIDLANINSCSFIATQDLGRVYENGSFEVIGRFDHSDIRGCNLMVI